jgi:hypothetical protein
MMIFKKTKTHKGLKLLLLKSENLKDVRHLAQLALYEHLYVEGWQLKGLLQTMAHCDDKETWKAIHAVKLSTIFQGIHNPVLNAREEGRKEIILAYLFYDEKGNAQKFTPNFYLDGKHEPVAIIVKTDVGQVLGESIYLQFFVKEEYRRHGIASTLNKNMGASQAICEYGDEASEHFFHKMNLSYFKNFTFYDAKPLKKKHFNFW